MDASVTESPRLGIRSPLSLLPLELQYAIIGWLQEDQPAIASCSLVCRRWQPIGQSILFQTVKFQRSGETRVPRFLQFVRANLDIAGYIHALHLDGFYKLSFGALRVAVGTMTHLHTLKLLLVTLQFDPADSESSHVAHPRPSLKKLVISYCDPSPSSDNNIAKLLSVVCLFSEIDHLAVKGDDWVTLSSIDGYVDQAPVVRSLKVYTRQETRVFAMHRMVRASGSLRGRISYLGISAGTIAAAVALAGLVREAGPHLRTLKLSLFYEGWGDVSVSGECSMLHLECPESRYYVRQSVV
ncbi:hypothetical protein OH76DRAFT_1021776 [Lentinus brumalis]|uniref:F-box domain-containing protein n=1 Tax=Lentinus brumalis TaxID=2498619 RepID=A0A371CXV7_9APHY|nr:hypothetical protein OH76DRAFT_1021776 [Polyporus brumalis]